MAAGAAAVAAAIANAIKASGVLVRMEPQEFDKVLRKIEKPLVVYSESGLFSTKFHYMVSYKGFVFYARTPTPLQLPIGTEVVNSSKIWIPS